MRRFWPMCMGVNPFFAPNQCRSRHDDTVNLESLYIDINSSSGRGGERLFRVRRPDAGSVSTSCASSIVHSQLDPYKPWFPKSIVLRNRVLIHSGRCG